MRKTITAVLFPAALFITSQSSIAQMQALTYADCVVHDVPSLEAAITSAYDSMADGPRPQIYLDQWLWNGEFQVTHRLIVAHSDYAALSAFRARLRSDPAASMRTGASIDLATDCQTDGLAVFSAAWGMPTGAPVFWQVYGIAASDGAAYAEALGDLAEARGDALQAVVVLFENRAGISGDTHLVAIGAPTFAGLNEFLDELFSSDDFADFNDEVSSIRRVTWRAQAFRARTWAPEGN